MSTLILLLMGVLSPVQGQNTINPPDFSQRIGILHTHFNDLGEFAESYEGFHHMIIGTTNEVLNEYFMAEPHIQRHFKIGRDVTPFTPNIMVELSMTDLNVNHTRDMLQVKDYYGDDGSSAQHKLLREKKLAHITATVILRDWKSCTPIYQETFQVKGSITRARNIVHGNERLVPEKLRPPAPLLRQDNGIVVMQELYKPLRDEEAVSRALFTLNYRVYKIIMATYVVPEMKRKHQQEWDNRNKPTQKN